MYRCYKEVYKYWVFFVGKRIVEGFLYYWQYVLGGGVQKYDFRRNSLVPSEISSIL